MSAAKIFRSCRRFRVVGDVPEGFREEYLAALEREAFTESVAISREARSGWCEYGKPLAPPSDWCHNQYAVFSLRIDQRRIPGPVLRARVDKSVADWCGANSRERCPAQVRAEIRENTELELLRSTIPTMKVLNVFWDISEGWVVFSAQTERMTDLFRKLFHRTFGLVVEEDVPVAEGDGYFHSVDANSDWLAWLIWKSETGHEVHLEDENARILVDGALKLSGLRSSGVGPAVLASLSAGVPVEGLVLGLAHGDREYLVKFDGVSQTGVHLPKSLTSGEEDIFEAAFHYEDCQLVLSALWAEFVAARENAGEQHQRALNRWVAEGLEPVQAFLERLRA